MKDHKFNTFDASPRHQASESWWIGVSREELQRRAVAELPRMQLSKFSRPTTGFVAIPAPVSAAKKDTRARVEQVEGDDRPNMPEAA